MCGFFFPHSYFTKKAIFGLVIFRAFSFFRLFYIYSDISLSVAEFLIKMYNTEANRGEGHVVSGGIALVNVERSRSRWRLN